MNSAPLPATVALVLRGTGAAEFVVPLRSYRLRMLYRLRSRALRHRDAEAVDTPESSGGSGRAYCLVVIADAAALAAGLIVVSGVLRVALLPNTPHDLASSSCRWVWVSAARTAGAV